MAMSRYERISPWNVNCFITSSTRVYIGFLSMSNRQVVWLLTGNKSEGGQVRINMYKTLMPVLLRRREGGVGIIKTTSKRGRGVA